MYPSWLSIPVFCYLSRTEVIRQRSGQLATPKWTFYLNNVDFDSDADSNVVVDFFFFFVDRYQLHVVGQDTRPTPSSVLISSLAFLSSPFRMKTSFLFCFSCVLFFFVLFFFFSFTFYLFSCFFLQFIPMFLFLSPSLIIRSLLPSRFLLFIATRSFSFCTYSFSTILNTLQHVPSSISFKSFSFTFGFISSFSSIFFSFAQFLSFSSFLSITLPLSKSFSFSPFSLYYFRFSYVLSFLLVLY
ncbi:unnamed protein product [Acanthosepion pharaonis]|uniref:Uncharacterized protein n=1 Tax=Acanthosepion pharaonis TaxID=158019 RepID=A0A812AU86_ACAPH|nr:unnamed protein product [Sepia pharaonis]